jgi:hypothetical protein
VLRGRGRARDLHSEDAVTRHATRSASRIVAFATITLVTLVGPAMASCAKRGPSPSAALEGRRQGLRDGGRRRDSGAWLEEEEAEREDLAAVEAGISLHALPCAADRDCMTHRCDAETKHCRFPCRSDDDCNPGAHCDADAGSLAACFTR